MNLDKRSPYGHITGKLEGYSGARYYQDGRYFDGRGVEIFAYPVPKPEPTAPAPKPAAPKRKQSTIVELAFDGEE